MAHSEQIKAACMAALLEGQGVTHVAAQWNLPESTVRDWNREVKSGKTVPKKSRIEALLFSYLETNLETLRLQSEFFRREDWLAAQDAGQAAVLHGVVADKSVRLLEALQAGADGEDGEPGEDPGSPD